VYKVLLPRYCLHKLLIIYKKTLFQYYVFHLFIHKHTHIQTHIYMQTHTYKYTCGYTRTLAPWSNERTPI